MTEMLLESVTTLALVVVAFFVPLGPHVPSSKAARSIFILAPLALLIFSQYLWATTGRSLLDRLTCYFISIGAACQSLHQFSDTVDINDPDTLDQICPAALANAQNIDRVPYIAKLATLNPQPVSSDRYICRAEGRGITYFITVKVRCTKFGQGRCAPVMRVETDTGEVIWQALE